MPIGGEGGGEGGGGGGGDVWVRGRGHRAHNGRILDQFPTLGRGWGGGTVFGRFHGKRLGI